MQLTTSIDRFSAFISQERQRYAGNDNNRVALSFAQASRYLRFLETIEDRYLAANEIVVIGFRRRMARVTSEGGIRELSEQEVDEIEQGWRQSLALHLEIESFLVFAKTLLDKLAQGVDDFFGTARGLSLRSHDQWCKNAEAFAAAKGLSLPGNMLATMLELRAKISDFRDKMIAHLQNPRIAHATTITAEGTTALGFGFLSPKDSDRVATEAIPVPRLAALIEQYIEQFVEFVDRNRSKTRYKLL